uniref:KIAA0513 n=1 Tax=Scleropages formosus TaxID=113540 RepID=A0A8C9SPH1_SCLFO
MEGEGVAVGNLIDFDVSPSSSAPPCGDGDGNNDRDGGNDSEATESADSENDETNSPSHTWSSSRRSSSSSGHSAEEVAPEVAECREFMKNYVEKMFYGKEEFEQEEKARFGELCSGENNKGREWFAKYVSAQRCNSKCVSEQTFYRLVQAFAVVLFECYQMDDYSPAKNLMTMCFTYYHIGRSQLSPTELLERPTSSIDSYLRSANSWLSGKKDMAERLLKNTSAKTDVKGFFGGLESKLRGPSVNKTEDTESPVEGKPKTPVSPESPEGKKGEKIYLYTHLKQQPIWHTLRFWNAAFFDAVHCERKKRSPTTREGEGDGAVEEKWCHMTQEERDDSSRFNENITFGQLGTFTHNMLAFGLSKKLCNDFLKKQAVIGNLNEEQYKLLSDHIEEMAVE